jgi:glycosyltransferase involved in cell wall biosynthesis
MQVISPFLSEPEPKAPANPAAPKSGRPYCLFAGRLEATKGLQDVIPLFEDDSPAELWIAGAGSYEGELRRLAAGRKSVRFLGFQRFPDLQRLYRNARVVVMPSLCYEVFPMVVLEAFREGTPIIARQRGPFPEIIQTSGGGLLFTTVDDLRSALHRVVSDDVLRAQLSRRALEAFHVNWTEAVGLGRYFALIERLAAARGIGALTPARHAALTA